MATVKKQYAKIIDEQTKELQVGVGCDVAYYLEIGMEYMETELAYNGRWYLKGYAPQKPQPDPRPKTKEEVQKIREDLYRSEVDPITSHIQRLRDERQTEPIKRQINDLLIERDNKVIKIRTENPYPEEGK